MTYGHLDIVSRASKCFDRLYIVVFENNEKAPMFTADERVAMMQEACRDMSNVEVDRSSGLLVDYARTRGAGVIVKGLRAVSDFDYEFKMALMNKKLAPGIETLFMMTSLEHMYLSSSLVKEVAGYGGSIVDLVPPGIGAMVIDRLTRKGSGQGK